MPFERETIPYKTIDNQDIHFREKRLDFWFHTVPADIRRLEYELWKRYRVLFYLKKHGHERKEQYGRFTYKTAYTKEMRTQDWREFQESFLFGEERKRRFDEIIEQTERDLPDILTTIPSVVRRSSVQLVALFGSSFYGPRKPGEVLSDVDVHFLLHDKTADKNFDILPKYQPGSNAIPYHLVGTGQSDVGRGDRLIHWLLYPHFPVWNGIPPEELHGILHHLVEQTRRREDEIQSGMRHLDATIDQESREKIHG